MKDYLSKYFQIWMDVDNMHGSVLEAMASAVENSFCVIMCMSQKYKDSKNCKLEAEYVYCTNKRFVPLIMQKEFKPNGW